MTEAVDRAVSVLGSRPAALMTDIDGTISEIAPTPTLAFVAEGATQALRRIARTLDVTGAISGRSVESAALMLGLEELLYVGNHGFETRRDGVDSAAPGATELLPVVQQALAEIAQAVGGSDPGILVENKRFTGSIHYRLTADPIASRLHLMTIITPIADRLGLRVVDGKMVVELRPPLHVDKGTALERLIEIRSIRGLVFLGDDVTDVDGFRAISARRAAGSIKALNIAVVSEESNPIVAVEADLVIRGVSEAVNFLSRVADRLNPIPLS